MKYIPLNLRLMAHPINWITILLMVLFGAIVVDILDQWFQQNAAQGGANG